MEKTPIRLLSAGEIECRIGTINEKGLSLLLFKDARADQKILDETYGSLGWKRSHQSIDGNLYCTVEVWDSEKKTWVSKQDVGTASYTEKEKGQASDSFKRACVNWGIGRELYTAPFIWVPAAKADIRKSGDRYTCNLRFQVQAITYNEQREISALTITDQEGRQIYTFQERGRGSSQDKGKEAAGYPKENSQTARKNTKPNQTLPASRPDVGQMEQMEKELKRTGVDLSAVLERYHLQDIFEMTPDIYESAMKSLKKTKSKPAA